MHPVDAGPHAATRLRHRLQPPPRPLSQPRPPPQPWSRPRPRHPPQPWPQSQPWSRPLSRPWSRPPPWPRSQPSSNSSTQAYGFRSPETLKTHTSRSCCHRRRTQTSTPDAQSVSDNGTPGRKPSHKSKSALRSLPSTLQNPTQVKVTALGYRTTRHCVRETLVLTCEGPTSAAVAAVHGRAALRKRNQNR